MFVCVCAVSPAQASESCKGKTITVFGDSLVAGYGLGPGEAFPEQLAVSLRSRGYALEVLNAGVSGDTTSGGLSRLDWSLGEASDVVILELGANDALRGIPVEITENNLDQMIARIKEKAGTVLLAGMQAPPNMGADYGNRFNAIYPKLAEKHDIALYPFFLEGVAAIPDLNQVDGIHPTKQGIAEIVRRVQPDVIRILDTVCEK